MRRRTAIGALVSLAGFPMLRVMPAIAPGKVGGTLLFNRKDLTGWDTWLGKPNKAIDVPGQEKNAQGEYVGPVGLNTDPKGVFSVVHVDGEPTIRISGEVFGALTTKEEFENFHLRFNFKWGEKKWPPRLDRPRDSGCLYHCNGPHGAGSGHWMQSLECQIQEGDCGDFWSVAKVIVDVEGIDQNPNDPNAYITYQKGAPKVIRTIKRIVKDGNHERPSGEWNEIDIFCVGQTSVHMINGTVNMRLTGLRHKVDDQEVPLTKGKLQFQSEGAEVFYRNFVVRPISEIPAQLLS
jgi:hypothetical protein